MFAVKLGDLDYFIAPSVECIAPLFPKKNDDKNQIAKPLDLDADMPLVTTNTDQVKPDLIKSSGENKIAAVSLQDCLACSGCVTSAETVLIQQHSTEEFLKLFNDKENQVIVAFSPQSVSSMAHYASI